MLSSKTYWYITIVSIGIVITSNGSLTAGQSYFLDCSVTETTDPATYQWFNSNGTQLTNTSQLSFSPLLASHAGNYTCRATVGSLVLPPRANYSFTVQAVNPNLDVRGPSAYYTASTTAPQGKIM